MGIIDKFTYTFTCPKCGTQEQAHAVEKGSRWGGTWGSPSALSLFTVAWKDDQFGAPEPASATCTKCGTEANVKIS